MKFLIFCFLFYYVEVVLSVKRFDGYKVYNVIPKTKDHAEVIKNLQNKRILELWEDSIRLNDVVKVMVSKEKQNAFFESIRSNDIDTKQVIEDLQKLIDLQKTKRAVRNSEPLLSMDWDNYYSLEDIYQWLDELAEAYPSVVTVVSIGQSVENRDIKGVRLNYHPDRNDTLIGMFEGTMHAREWISAATVTWILKEFLTSTQPEIRALAENFEWHFFPVVNPDGYSYTFTNNRLWRKNRSRASFKSCNVTGVDVEADDMSNGVDLNRNFDFEWNTVGVSSDSCDNTFPGPSAFSEPETRAVAEYVQSLQQRGEIIYYIAFHSYSQLMIVPYSHVSGVNVLMANNYGDMYEIAMRGADTLKIRSGTTYTVGVSTNVMYAMSGTSFDWVKYAADVPVTYLIELRDLGESGFLLPPEQIVPSNLEIMDALLEMDKTTRDLKYYYSSSNIVVTPLLLIVASLLLRLTFE